MPVKDLSNYHQPVSSLFNMHSSRGEWKEYELPEEQVRFFRKNGFVSGIKLLDDHQIKFLREELATVADPAHEGHELFYEFHSNESTDPSTILFHALGAWRIMP